MPELLSKEQKQEFDRKLKMAIDDGYGYAKVIVEKHLITFIVGESSIKIKRTAFHGVKDAR